jgi:hypothetical protein
MDPLLSVAIQVVGGAAGFALFVYVLYRGVMLAKKAGRAGMGGQIVGTALMFFSFGTALDPAREVAAESRKLKRKQDGSGDPDLDSQLAESTNDRRDQNN